MNITPDHRKIVNPRRTPETYELYCAVKDLRMSARKEEKYGNISSQVLDEWNKIYELLQRLFTMNCYDLELYSWLIESTLRLKGFSGLSDVLQTITNQLKTFGTTLTSVESAIDMPQYWLASISELSGEGGEGVLIQALRLCPFIPQQRYGTYNLWHYQTSIKDREGDAFHVLNQAINNAGHAAVLEQRENILSCIQHYRAMIAQCELLLPETSPASANLLAVLHECVHAINDLCGTQYEPAASTGNKTAQIITENNFPVMPANFTIQNREQAFLILESIALFFHQNEPQSPISQVLKTLIRRGRLPFSEMLQELLHDDVARRGILATAGIHIPED
ncbi:ImpA family type VI secretion system protein [Paenochrobactrum glaciei]|uniref:type VI secretion system protein TssA n=1 Tax=Paenochrobactrum glaciei TaxID=486407 RepID=UPI0031DFCE33